MRDTGAATVRAADVVSEVLALPGLHAAALDALLSLASVEWSDDVPTACVECVDRPRLLLNRAFVTRRCRTPERLAMLVLHELSHVMLGHTRLFPRPTEAHNIAFDAVINASIAQWLRGTGAVLHRHIALLEDCYDPAVSPTFLLRPPPRWPAAPDWDASRGAPKALRSVHRRLYATRASSSSAASVRYGEIITALVRHGSPEWPHPQLLGGHGATDAERAMLSGTRDGDAAHALEGALAVLQPVLRGALAGTGGTLAQVAVPDAAALPSLHHALRGLLRRASSGDGRAGQRPQFDTRPVLAVHRLHDRRAACRVRLARMLGAPAPLLFDSQATWRRPAPLGLHVYVDVSGSMDGLLPHLRTALLSLQHEIRPVLHWFSTAVHVARLGELRDGRVPSTGGTAIGAVLAHLREQARDACSVLVLTDGHLERVVPSQYDPLIARGVRIHLGVIGSGPLHEGAGWVSSSTRLPSP